MKEMKKLYNYLKDNDYNVERKHDKKHEHDQIIVRDKDGRYCWDAICQPGSYGYSQGLIEIAGSITGDRLIGWLTADDIIRRVEGLRYDKTRESAEWL